MARETVKREIDGSLYEFHTMPAKAALKVLTRLTKVVGEPLGLLGDALLGGGKAGAVGAEGDGLVKGALETDIPQGALGKVLAAVTDRLDENQVLETVELVLVSVYVQGPSDAGTRTIRFEQDFGGRMLTMLKVFAAALEVNFSDFFAAGGGAGAIMARARAAAGSLK